MEKQQCESHSQRDRELLVQMKVTSTQKKQNKYTAVII